MKRIKVLLLIAILVTSTLPTYSYAAELSNGLTNNEKLIMAGPPVIKNDPGMSMKQGSDMISSLPPIVFYNRLGEQVEGIFTYPNYDNMRLGVWDLEWVFTPNDPKYECATGTLKLNVWAPEPEEIETPTPPSLTATSVQLNTMTTYDINLNDKVSGSTYQWNSSDPNVVEVNSKSGLLKAKSEGRANVTCKITFPDQTQQVLTSDVTVGYDENAPVLTETDIDLEPGDTYDINLENKVANSKYRWISSDRSVAVVNSANGKVTAKVPGTAYVTCTITTPDNQVIVLRADVNVTAPAVTTE